MNLQLRGVVGSEYSSTKEGYCITGGQYLETCTRRGYILWWEGGGGGGKYLFWEECLWMN